jgi:hypothetical protein
MGKRKKPPESGCSKITSFFSPVTHNVGSTSSSSSTAAQPPASNPTPSINPKTRATKRKGQTTPDDDDDGEILPPSALPPPTKQTHACNKTSFASVFRPSSARRALYFQRFLTYRKTMQSLARHATYFLKYYVLKYHTAHASYPDITEDHFHVILYLLNKLDKWKPQSTGKQDFATLRRELLPYVRSYIRLMRFTPPQILFDQQPIRYLAASLNTNLTVNIAEHFTQMLLRYINLRLGEYSDKICGFAVPF